MHVLFFFWFFFQERGFDGLPQKLKDCAESLEGLDTTVRATNKPTNKQTNQQTNRYAAYTRIRTYMYKAYDNNWKSVLTFH